MQTTIEAALVALGPSSDLVDVTLEDGIIAAIEPSSANQPSGYLLPGLIDTHIHLTGRHNLVALARAGVTTGIDLGTHPDSLIAELRDQPGVASILSAGSAASAAGGTQTTQLGFPLDSVVANPADAERFVQWRADNGADLIKIIIEDPTNPRAPGLPPETLRALVAAAHAHALLTVAHVVTTASFTLGLDAGVDVLTHAPRDRALPPETVARMIDAGTVASPTLIMMRAMAKAFAHQADPEAAFAASLASVTAMHAAGVPIIAGTDANEIPLAPVVHGSSLHDELGLLVEAGLSPREALIAATSGAAAGMRLADRGRIEPGLRADLVLLDADPVADLAAARTPRKVWVAGVPVELG